MTRQTRKSTTSTTPASDDKWGQPVTPKASSMDPANYETVPEQFEKLHGHFPDFSNETDVLLISKLYDARYGTNAAAGFLPAAKGKRAAFKPYVPEPTKTFADDCEDTPVPLTKLLEILAYQRFAGTQGEADMIKSIIIPLPGVDRDKYGNYWLIVPSADGSAPTTLFSSHTDTVEKQKAKGLKELELTGAMLTTKGGGVLGADDGAGIWLMLNLIEAKIPGLYIFHREEETGGGGSSHIAHKTPEMLAGIKRAIAFDRKDLNHIITHQGGERCCSDAFAKAFGAMLNDACEGFDFHGDDTGSFTDTKNYTELVAECTNLSVGYYDQHTMHECQDLSFLTRLANALIKVEWDVLPTERDPKEVDDRWGAWASYSRRYGSVKATAGDEELEEFENFVDLVADNPRAVVQILMDCGYDVWGLESEIDRIQSGK